MSEVAPEARIWELVRGALTTRALGLVAELDVAGALGDGPRSVEELAAPSRSDPDTLHRLLRALASEGVFEERKRGVFANTVASELLRGGGGWREFAILFGGTWARCAVELDVSGRATFPSTAGTDFWSWLAEHKRERALFDTAMEQGGAGRLARLEALDWRGDEVVVDVGGGNGSLLEQFLAPRPRMRGIVFDLPETVRDGASFGDRLRFVEGSFFESVPDGDVYLLVTILHDWDDEHAAAILRTIRTSARPHARLIVLDAVVPPGNDPLAAKWLDLLMLALLGGRERDEEQWRTLLEAGGFERLRFHEAMIEARCRS
jgi:hypothetical protein